MKTDNRPLSPHLQIYKPQLTSVLSITHRGTGVFLCLGAVLFSTWLLAAAAGPGAYAVINAHISAWYGQVADTVAQVVIERKQKGEQAHLAWDMGLGFEIRTTYISGYVVVGATLVLTAATWCLAGGGA